MLARFGIFGDLQLFPDVAVHPEGATSRFRLDGTVDLTGDAALLTVTLVEMPEGRLLDQERRLVQADATLPEQYSTAMDVLLSIRPTIFSAEHALRHHAARDAIDLLVDSHVADQKPGQQGLAIRLAEKATAREPAHLPARVWLAVLSTYEMALGDARLGDDAGRRGLRLIDGVLAERSGNFLYLYDRAFILYCLGRLDEAEATAETGLRIEPGDDLLDQVLAEIFTQKGDLVHAAALMRDDNRDPTSASLAFLAYAKGDYVSALSLVRRATAAIPDHENTPSDMLLEVGTLVRLHQLAAARILCAKTLQKMPDRIRTVAALRQSLYGFPNETWAAFVRDLGLSGMPP